MKANQIARRVAVAVLFIFGGLAVALARWPEARMTPEPFDVASLSKLGDRATLRPQMRRIIEDLESNRLLGSIIDNRKDDFEMPDEIRVASKKTAYLFFVFPNEQDQEGLPILAVEVQNRYRQVLRCLVTVPCY